MRGELTFASRSPGASAVEYTQRLADVLREERPRRLEVRASHVSVRGGIFRLVWNWNLLAGVTSATIDVIPGHDGVTVRYDIRVTELLVCCTFASLLAIATATILGRLLLAIIAVPMIWGWMFGANYLATQYRMKAVFRRVAAEVAMLEAEYSASDDARD